MALKCVNTVLERILYSLDDVRKLTRLSKGDEGGAERLRDGGAEDEAAALDGDDMGDGMPANEAAMASVTSRKSELSRRTGVMSLNTMPGFGKSGTSRITAANAMRH